MNFLKVLVLFLFLFASGLVSAQNTSSSLKKDERKTTRLNFEDELIEGDVSSPDLLFILKSKNASYGRLLKLRDNFLPEINETKHDILRGSK